MVGVERVAEEVEVVEEETTPLVGVDEAQRMLRVHSSDAQYGTPVYIFTIWEGVQRWDGALHINASWRYPEITISLPTQRTLSTGHQESGIYFFCISKLRLLLLDPRMTQEISVSRASTC